MFLFCCTMTLCRGCEQCDQQQGPACWVRHTIHSCPCLLFMYMPKPNVAQTCLLCMDKYLACLTFNAFLVILQDVNDNKALPAEPIATNGAAAVPQQQQPQLQQVGLESGLQAYEKASQKCDCKGPTQKPCS